MDSRRDARTPPGDQDREKMLKSIMKATGLTRDAVEELYMSDSDLDERCDSILSDLSARPEKSRTS